MSEAQQQAAELAGRLAREAAEREQQRLAQERAAREAAERQRSRTLAPAEAPDREAGRETPPPPPPRTALDLAEIQQRSDQLRQSQLSKTITEVNMAQQSQIIKAATDAFTAYKGQVDDANRVLQDQMRQSDYVLRHSAEYDWSGYKGGLDGYRQDAAALRDTFEKVNKDLGVNETNLRLGLSKANQNLSALKTAKLELNALTSGKESVLHPIEKVKLTYTEGGETKTKTFDSTYEAQQFAEKQALKDSKYIFVDTKGERIPGTPTLTSPDQVHRYLEALSESELKKTEGQAIPGPAASKGVINLYESVSNVLAESVKNSKSAYDASTGAEQAFAAMSFVGAHVAIGMLNGATFFVDPRAWVSNAKVAAQVVASGTGLDRAAAVFGVKLDMGELEAVSDFASKNQIAFISQTAGGILVGTYVGGKIKVGKVSGKLASALDKLAERVPVIKRIISIAKPNPAFKLIENMDTDFIIDERTGKLVLDVSAKTYPAWWEEAQRSPKGVAYLMRPADGGLMLPQDVLLDLDMRATPGYALRDPVTLKVLGFISAAEASKLVQGNLKSLSTSATLIVNGVQYIIEPSVQAPTISENQLLKLDYPQLNRLLMKLDTPQLSRLSPETLSEVLSRSDPLTLNIVVSKLSVEQLADVIPVLSMEQLMHIFPELSEPQLRKLRVVLPKKEASKLERVRAEVSPGMRFRVVLDGRVGVVEADGFVEALFKVSRGRGTRATVTRLS